MQFRRTAPWCGCTGVIQAAVLALPAPFAPEALDAPLPVLGGTALYRAREAVVASADAPKLIAGTHRRLQ